ncbi:alpha/beta hydrolase [Gemmata sp. JC717]|uniref:alpha/beta hydrolase n=1 Tax=Gemmata algarum TaxID=2975278 RepID=UPI0021BA9A46|nr:alpha/beta hydrolase [Gemmata algarum]MDY3555011.1 alpha/beta hydrolase [Gemmata algarum]
MKWLTRSLFALASAVAASGPAPAEDKKPVPAPTAARTAAEVEVVKDLAYAGTADEHQKLDLYLPKGQKGYPLVLFLHGGGFSKGDRKDAALFGEALAKQGVGVAAVGYRLFPEAKHPQPVQDAAKALAWLKSNAAARGWRADAVFVSGHSAGGHLATLLATDEQYLKAEKLAAGDIRGVIALSGAYVVPEARKDVFGDEAARKAASPLTHVKAGLPPFLLVYADKDSPGRDQLTKEFAAALLGVRGTAQVIEAKDREHGTLFTKIAAGDPTGEAVIAFVRKHSGKK